MIFGWWKRWQRKQDIRFLWPEILDEADDRDKAKLAFRTHMDLDDAYDGMTDSDKRQFIEELP